MNASQNSQSAGVDLRAVAEAAGLPAETLYRRVKRAGLVPLRTGPDGRHYYRWDQLAPLVRAHRPASEQLTISQRLGAAVRREREAQNTSREELADRIGASAGIVAAIERGRHQCTVDRLAAIADALGAAPSVVLAAALGRPDVSPLRRFTLLSRATATPVADGVQWTDRAVVLRTRGPESAVTYAETLEAALPSGTALAPAIRWCD
jgi:transcriptional regulator with XRE-family HTH domain